MGDIKFCCRVCGQKLAIDSAAAGWEIRCPKCGTSQTAPPAPATDPEAAAQPAASSTEPQPAIPEFASRAPSGGEEFEYEAFISYRHVEPDRTLAKWLHTALETYRVPKILAQERGLPLRLKKLFRDEDELPASADLSKEIESALRKSRFLIVVCSPRTPASEWVNAEVKFFRALGRNDQILALLIEGEPGESFPQALREIRRTVVEQAGATRETIENVEPLAADVRLGRKESQRRLRKLAKLRMLASLLGVPFDALRQRDRARKIRRIIQVALASLCLIGGIAGLYWKQNLSLKGIQEAARKDLSSAKAMLESARKDLEDVAGLPAGFVEAQPKWVSASDETKKLIVQQRETIITGIPTFTVPQLVNQVNRPSSQGNAPTPLPEKFLIEGWLIAVRHVESRGLDKTLVFLGPQSSFGTSWRFLDWMESEGERASNSPASVAPPLVCVAFDGRVVSRDMADYHSQQAVSVAVRRNAWARKEAVLWQLKPFAASVRASESGASISVGNTHWNEFCRFNSRPSKILWTAAGEGIEKLGDSESWIDPKLGRSQQIVDRAALNQPLGIIRRDLQRFTGIHGLLEARFEGLLHDPSASSQPDRISLEISVPDSIEGSVTLVAYLGGRVKPEDFERFSPGDPIQMEATVMRPDSLSRYTRLTRATTSNTSKTPTPSRLQGGTYSPTGPADLTPTSPRASSTPAVNSGVWVQQINKKTDQLSDLLPQFPVATTIGVSCAWVQIKGKPETVVKP